MCKINLIKMSYDFTLFLYCHLTLKQKEKEETSNKI